MVEPLYTVSVKLKRIGISLANKIKKHDEKTVDYLVRNGCDPALVDKLTEPMDVVNFFNGVYQNDYWRRFGFLADWRRFTCTLYPDYGKFIEWQFTKLKEKGLLIQKPYYAPFWTMLYSMSGRAQKQTCP